MLQRSLDTVSNSKSRKKYALLFAMGFIGTFVLYNVPSSQQSIVGLNEKPLKSLKINNIAVEFSTQPGKEEMKNTTRILINDVKSNNKPKIILFWTTFFGTHVWGRSQTDLNRICPASNCRLTADRGMLNESDAVMFHFNWNDKLDSIPPFRRPEQRYVYVSFESALRSRINFPWKKIPRDFFNWTATYRLDSDLFGKTFYGFDFERKEFIQPRINDLTNYYGFNITAKTKLAAWFVSNCKTSINREGYVRELRRHIPVDVFGKCLENHKSCPKENNYCNAMLKSDYLFYLSFENSFCPDYVTEKFYRAFDTGTVPVVFGGANYSLFAPPNSYINARDFQTPKLLAEYLLKLSRNLELYSQYFNWRGEFNLKRNSGWCHLCEMLNDPTARKKSYPIIEEWFFDKYSCENYHWTNLTLN